MNAKSPLTILAVAAFLHLGCAPAPAPTPVADPAALIEAAEQLDREFMAAFNNRDVEALNNCYWNSPDTILFPPDALQHRGIESIRAYHAATLASMPEGAKLEVIESHQTPVGDAVAGAGLFRLTIPGEDGPTVMEGRFSDVKAERDGKWVYMVDHASFAPAPPPAE